MCCLCASSIRFLNGWQVRKVKEPPKKPWQLVLISLCKRAHLFFSCLSKIQFANITFSGYSLKFQSGAAEGRWLGLHCALLNNQVQRASCFKLVAFACRGYIPVGADRAASVACSGIWTCLSTQIVRFRCLLKLQKYPWPSLQRAILQAGSGISPCLSSTAAFSDHTEGVWLWKY